MLNLQLLENTHRSLHDYFIIIISLSDLGLSPAI